MNTAACAGGPRLWALAIVIALTLPSSAAWALDQFSDQHSKPNFVLRAPRLTLALKGELELELHDLQGEGGPGFDSATDTATLGTRSPFFEVDAFRLALRVGYEDLVGVNTVVAFTSRGAALESAWIDLELRGPAWLGHRLILGLEQPIIALDRRTERYPLAATIYWRHPELQLSWQGTTNLSADVSIEVGVALAIMRPLTFAGVRDSDTQPGTINILALGTARPFSGNGPSGTGRLRVTTFGAFVEGFATLGSLAAEAGSDVLRSGLSRYRELPGDSASSDFGWYGGRLGFDGYGVHALLELIRGRMGLLDRHALTAQISVAIRLWDGPVFHTIEPLVRWERVGISDSARLLSSGNALRSPAPIDAPAWDTQALTGALAITVYRDLVRLRLEYAALWEDNGVPALGLASVPLRNDEFLAQLELRF
ncbi:MAG: hypothetical protein ACI9WU_000279 [Myxococcota bacterium]|jgi:hypothetical protein